MSLTLEEANRILRGALAKARELNIRISAAVCDAGGRLVAFQRMDNAIWASAYASQGKAVASAAFGRPSGEMADRADQPTPRGVVAAEGGHIIMGQGAVPIIRNGLVVTCVSKVTLRKASYFKVLYLHPLGLPQVWGCEHQEGVFPRLFVDRGWTRGLDCEVDANRR